MRTIIPSMRTKNIILRVCAWWLGCIVSVSANVKARAAVPLVGFSDSHPVKIMPMGDSITDDFVYNGAWRLPLQPLLDTSGYPFTFVGRKASTAVPGVFTKVGHEGWCGATT